MQLQHLVHEGEVDAHATIWRGEVALEAGPSGEGNCSSCQKPPTDRALRGEDALIGTRYLWHAFAISDTSAVLLGYATATGKVSMLVDDHSE